MGEGGREAMSGVAKLASPDPSVHSLTQACAELGHSSRTVTGRSFTVANRVRSRTFATLLLHEVYPRRTAWRPLAVDLIGECRGFGAGWRR